MLIPAAYVPTTTTTTTTIFGADNVDCEEKQDACTAACETKFFRNYKVIAPKEAKGKACVGATDCQPGDGACPLPTTTTTTTTVTTTITVTTVTTTRTGTTTTATTVTVEQLPTIAEALASAGQTNTLVSLLSGASLLGPLNNPGQMTIFAPTDAAFSPAVTTLYGSMSVAEQAAVLKYHVLTSKALQLSDFKQNEVLSTMGSASSFSLLNVGQGPDGWSIYTESEKVIEIVQTPKAVQCSNGVIHFLRKVMLPKSVLRTTVAETTVTTVATDAPSTSTIVELAVATPALSTLVAAVTAGDLVGTLSSVGPFTVFAPTNDAFNALPAGEVTRLLLAENKAELVAILTYHVVVGTTFAGDLTDGETLTTVEGTSLKVTISGSNVYINGAKVAIADIGASNGVVHMIDGVLMPTASSGGDGGGVDAATAATDASTTTTVQTPNVTTAAPDASAEKSSASKTVMYAAVGGGGVVLLVLVVVLAFCVCKMRNNNGGGVTGSNIAQAFRNPMYEMNNPTNSAAGSSNTFVGNNPNYADLPAAASNSVAYADVSGYDMSEA